MKNKTATCQLVAAKSQRKAIKSGNATWALKQKRRVNSKFNDKIKKYLFIWIMNHPQVVKSPIVDYCLKVNIYCHTETQLVPFFLLQVSARELHNSLISYTEDGGFTEARDADNNIIISDSTLRSLLPP